MSTNELASNIVRSVWEYALLKEVAVVNRVEQHIKDYLQSLPPMMRVSPDGSAELVTDFERRCSLAMTVIHSIAPKGPCSSGEHQAYSAALEFATAALLAGKQAQ